jgi:hypothetical protein
MPPHPWHPGPHPYPFPISGRWDVIQNGLVLGSYMTQVDAQDAISLGVFGPANPAEPFSIVFVS